QPPASKRSVSSSSPLSEPSLRRRPPSTPLNTSMAFPEAPGARGFTTQEANRTLRSTPDMLSTGRGFSPQEANRTLKPAPDMLSTGRGLTSQGGNHTLRPALETPDGQKLAPLPAHRPHMPLPTISMKFTKKQFEKISLDGLSIGRYQLQSLIGGNPIG